MATELLHRTEKTGDKEEGTNRDIYAFYTLIDAIDENNKAVKVERLLNKSTKENMQIAIDLQQKHINTATAEKANLVARLAKANVTL